MRIFLADLVFWLFSWLCWIFWSCSILREGSFLGVGSLVFEDGSVLFLEADKERSFGTFIDSRDQDIQKYIQKKNNVRQNPSNKG